MPVIRREGLAPAAAFSFTDLQQEARRIVEAARMQARALIAAAQANADKIRAAAEATGHQAGLAAGRQQGYAAARQAADERALADAQGELQQLGHALSQALQAFEAQRQHLLARAEAGLIDLAVAIATRVCKHVAAHDPQVAAANARALLEMVREQRAATLHLHPVDHEHLSAILPQDAAQISALLSLALTADPRVERGGCILHTGVGSLDARISTQLDRVAAALCGNGNVLQTAHDGAAAVAAPPDDSRTAPRPDIDAAGDAP